MKSRDTPSLAPRSHQTAPEGPQEGQTPPTTSKIRSPQNAPEGPRIPVICLIPLGSKGQPQSRQTFLLEKVGLAEESGFTDTT